MNINYYRSFFRMSNNGKFYKGAEITSGSCIENSKGEKVRIGLVPNNLWARLHEFDIFFQ